MRFPGLLFSLLFGLFLFRFLFIFVGTFFRLFIWFFFKLTYIKKVALSLLAILFNNIIKLTDDDFSDFNSWLIETLKILTAKTKVYLLPGNRDFLMGRKFAKSSGITLLFDPTIITLNQQRYLLTHGDLLTNYSFFYQIFYRVTHYKLLKKVLTMHDILLTLLTVPGIGL